MVVVTLNLFLFKESVPPHGGTSFLYKFLKNIQKGLTKSSVYDII